MELGLVCTFETSRSVEEIAGGILDLDMWSTFDGWGPLPGIERAEFLERTEAVVGSRVRSHNSDGSTHVETITKWDLPNEIELTFGEFSKPLRWFSDGFVERWLFERRDNGTFITRSVRMSARNVAGLVVLALVRPMMRRALMRHMREQLG